MKTEIIAQYDDGSIEIERVYTSEDTYIDRGFWPNGVLEYEIPFNSAGHKHGVARWYDISGGLETKDVYNEGELEQE